MALPATQLLAEFAEALFASPLFSFRVPEAPKLNGRLLAEVEALRRVDAGVGRSNLGGWHSSFDLFEREEPGCAELCGVLVAAVQQATLRVAPTFAFARWGLQCEGWFSVLPPGACNAPHTHPTYALSGVWVYPNTGPTERVSVAFNARWVPQRRPGA